MRYRKEFNFEGNPFSSFIGIILVALILLSLFFVARLIFTILYYLSPIMLIAALVLDYKVVLGYGKWLIGLVRRNAVMGIGAILLSILGFPVVSAFLLGKALFRKKVKEAEEQARDSRTGEYIEYEELDNRPLDLPPIEEDKKQPKQPEANRYDDLFD